MNNGQVVSRTSSEAVSVQPPLGHVANYTAVSQSTRKPDAETTTPLALLQIAPSSSQQGLPSLFYRIARMRR